ncbi:MAG: hypothetical protein GF383_10510 [Candidatus Lokiarchaeota archaeon]|nr:hypothetical protein [Candidatus Lokiarchaeota archaeon]MBD3341004.1 hypothetical protein [Candidatus Lokiarchaeota archaeon]
MVLFQLDVTRFFQIYVVQGIICAYFLYLIVKIFKRNKKRLNLILSGFYIFGIMSLTLNFIYAPLTNEFIVRILYFFTIYLLLFSTTFLVLFALVLLKSDVIIDTKKQILIVLAYAVGFLTPFIFYDQGGVTINASTDWKPVWSWPFFIYVLVLTGGITLAPILFYSTKIYHKLQEEKIKKKWKYYVIGILGIFIFTYGTLLSNTINIQTFRTVWSFIALFLVIVAPYMIYYGVGKQIG